MPTRLLSDLVGFFCSQNQTFFVCFLPLGQLFVGFEVYASTFALNGKGANPKMEKGSMKPHQYAKRGGQFLFTVRLTRQSLSGKETKGVNVRAWTMEDAKAIAKRQLESILDQQWHPVSARQVN